MASSFYILLCSTSISHSNLIRQGNLNETMSICHEEMNKEHQHEFFFHGFIDVGFQLVP
jgi:hypothetical protein